MGGRGTSDTPAGRVGHHSIGNATKYDGPR